MQDQQSVQTARSLKNAHKSQDIPAPSTPPLRLKYESETAPIAQVYKNANDP